MAPDLPPPPSPSRACLELVQHFEGFRPHAYKDGAGKWSIGWGTHIKPDGTRVQPGERISQETADEWMALELARITDDVLARELPGVVFEQHEVDALCSFIYNIGEGAFRRSSMAKRLRSGDRAGAALEFPRWNRIAGRISKGLTRRREAEQRLFLGEPWEP